MKNSMNGTILWLGLLGAPVIFGAEGGNQAAASPVPHPSESIAAAIEEYSPAVKAVRAAIVSLNDGDVDVDELPTSNPLEITTEEIGQRLAAESFPFYGGIEYDVTTLAARSAHFKTKDEIEFAIHYLKNLRPYGKSERGNFLRVEDAIEFGNKYRKDYYLAADIIAANPGKNLLGDDAAAREAMARYCNPPVPIPAPIPPVNPPADNVLPFHVKASWWQKHMSRYGVAYIVGTAALGLLVGSLITYKQYEKDIIAGKTQAAHKS